MRVGSPNLFVPSIIPSNVMSLAPKIDKGPNVMSSSSIDLACIVETWLQEHIHDNIISIPDFNVVRRDRVIKTSTEVFVSTFGEQLRGCS